MHHNLKAEPESFNLMALRTSDVQIRKNDRGFKPGDTCTFYEWSPVQGFYTGHVTKVFPVVTVLDHHEGLVPGWCLVVLKISRCR